MSVGGKGSGRKPTKKPLEDKIADSVARASEAAKGLPSKEEKKAAAEKVKKAETKKKTRHPKPQEFKDNPFAQALNAFADKAVGMPGSGAAAQSYLGESWMAVVEFYLPAIDHPLAIALACTAQFGVIVAMSKQAQKASEKPKGPGSPHGTNKPDQPFVMDAQCIHCGAVFPDLPQAKEHVLKEHPEATEPTEPSQ